MNRGPRIAIACVVAVVVLATYAMTRGNFSRAYMEIDPRGSFPFLFRSPRLWAFILPLLWIGLLAHVGFAIRSGPGQAARITAVLPAVILWGLGVAGLVGNSALPPEPIPSWTLLELAGRAAEALMLSGAMMLSLRAASAGAPRQMTARLRIAMSVVVITPLLWFVLMARTHAPGSQHALFAIAAGLVGGTVLGLGASGVRGATSEEARDQSGGDLLVAAVLVVSVAALAFALQDLVIRARPTILPCRVYSATERVRGVQEDIDRANTALGYAAPLFLAIAGGVVALVVQSRVTVRRAGRAAVIALGLALFLGLVSVNLVARRSHSIGEARLALAAGPCLER